MASSSFLASTSSKLPVLRHHRHHRKRANAVSSFVVRAQAGSPSPPTPQSSSSPSSSPNAASARRSGLDVAKSLSPAPLPTALSSSSSQRLSASAVRQPVVPSTQPARPAPGVLRVAIDVDEVLGRFLHKLNEFCKDEYGLDVDISDYHVYEFAKVWGCSRDASNEIVHAFFDSDHFAEGIEPIPGAAAALRSLSSSSSSSSSTSTSTSRSSLSSKSSGNNISLAVVTSRQHVIRQPTLEWLDAHFGLSLFDAGVHFGNHWALAGRSTSKSQLCASIGASVLVDDNPSYAAECADAGMKVLLYDWRGGYPWAKPGREVAERHPDRVEVVRDWREVEEALREIAAAEAAKAARER